MTLCHIVQVLFVIIFKADKRSDFVSLTYDPKISNGVPKLGSVKVSMLTEYLRTKGRTLCPQPKLLYK